jgi:small basic protein (TIGR04137 family)
MDGERVSVNCPHIRGNKMSLDRSLKSASALVRHRNVLTRAERLSQLTEEEKWNDTKSVYGLPKVGHRKMEVGKAVKEEGVEGEVAAVAGTAVPGAKAPAGAKGGAPAGGTKGAAPAAGGKGGAPAAKGGAPAAKGGAPAAKAAAPAGKKK